MIWAPSQQASRSSSAGWRAHWVWTIAAVLLASADAASGSRTGLLQLLLLLLLSLMWKRNRVRVGVLLVAYVSAAVLLPQLAGLALLDSGILGRIGQHVPTCASRLTLWRNVLELIAQKPWIGWGPGELAYAHFVTLYPDQRFCEILGNAHNLPLHIAVEWGLPTAFLFCLAIAWLLVRLKPWKESDSTRQLAWSVLAVIGLHSLLEYPLWYGPFQLATVLAAWILWSVRRPANQRAPSTLKRWQWALSIGLCLVCTFVTWDYWRISQIYLPVSERSPTYREDTLVKTSDSWFFQNQIKFAALGIATLDVENAAQVHDLALEMLHFSPEASVVQKLIESAKFMGLTDEVHHYAVRYKVAYPKEYAEWVQLCDKADLRIDGQLHCD
jgi:hypothetical protein